MDSFLSHIASACPLRGVIVHLFLGRREKIIHIDLQCLGNTGKLNLRQSKFNAPLSYIISYIDIIHVVLTELYDI